MDEGKILHWIKIVAIVVVAVIGLIVAPSLLGDLFHIFTDFFRGITDAAKGVGQGFRPPSP